MSGASATGATQHSPSRGRTVNLDPSGQVTLPPPDRSRRQFLNYAFFKVDREFRRLPAEDRACMKDEFASTIERWATSEEDLIVRTYSLVGLRAEVDFMLWRISHDLATFQRMQAALNATKLAGYLTQPYNFISLQRRSQYVNRIEGSGEGVELLPGQGKYLFVYPFVKTRAWYDLSPHARQGMMDEHIYASSPFKGVRLNTSFSYGIDDQEFVVAFDSDYPQEFVDLVERLRFTEASQYTLRDTPMFTCRQLPIREIMEQIG